MEDIKTIEKLYSTPPTNRGVVITRESEELSEFMLFDWLQFTILPLKDYCMSENGHQIETNSYNFVIYLFQYLFNISNENILCNEDPPVNGYEVCYSYRGIKVMQAPTREDMGTHFILSGEACRVLEDLEISYKELFKKLLQFNTQYTRVDVSYDVYHGKYFTLKKVENSIKNIEVLTKFRSSIIFTKDDLISLDNKGKTIWFGSRSSDIQFVFYDKKKQMIYNVNCEIDKNIEYWYRLECRFRHDKATKVIWNYLYVEDFNIYMKSILNNYLSFRIKNNNDKNRSRWLVKKWWSDFLDVSEKIQFQSRPIEYSISHKKNWLDRVASRSQLAVLLSTIPDLTIDNITADYLYEYFKGAKDKLKEKDIEIINEYRIKNKLNPIESKDIDSYISDIKDILIQK